jgi:hypothetical protein
VWRVHVPLDFVITKMDSISGQGVEATLSTPEEPAALSRGAALESFPPGSPRILPFGNRAIKCSLKHALHIDCWNHDDHSLA